MTTGPRIAEMPFEFYTLAHISRKGGQAAETLAELLEVLETCSDESIYHHTIVALRSQFASGGVLRNDFAKWAMESLEQNDLADQLAMVDECEHETLAHLRRALCREVREYLKNHPESAHQKAGTPFCFCEGMEVRVPVDARARTLEELRRGIQEMSGESLYLHFIAPRARLDQQSNDFSIWLGKHLGLKELAGKIDAIDVMEGTLERTKGKILELIDEASGPQARVAAGGAA